MKSKKDPIFNSAGTVAYLPSVNAVLTQSQSRSPLLSLGSQPTAPLVRNFEITGTDKMVYWGAANDFPQEIIKLARRNTIIPQALADKAALWLGGGLMATETPESDMALIDPEIEDFLDSITTRRYLLEALLDVSWWSNCFPEMILSKDREKIVQIHSNDTAHCRWEKMNPRTGKKENVYINANFPQASDSDELTIKVPALDPYQWGLSNWVRAQTGFKYIWPASFPSAGDSYYQVSAWDSARRSGWLEYLQSIPEFKLNAMFNQMAIKYHIEVPEDYWKKVYKEKWSSATTDGQKIIREQFLADLMQSLTGAKNANKGILTDSWKDAKGNDTGIKITVLNDNHKDGKYNEDYSDGLNNLLYAMGTDPSLFGLQSKDVQRSGGSDKRQSFFIFLSKSKPYRDMVIEPFKFIAEYNGWKKRYPRIAFKFRDTLLTTLDTGAPTTNTNTPA